MLGVGYGWGGLEMGRRKGREEKGEWGERQMSKRRVWLEVIAYLIISILQISNQLLSLRHRIL